MPTPLVHSAFGYALFCLGKRTDASHKSSRKELAGFILAANAADLDFIPGFIVGAPTAYHHYAMHSFVAAVGIGLLVYAVVQTRWLALIAAASSHPLLDMCTMDRFHAYAQHHGIPLFWPFESTEHSAFVPLFSAPYLGSDLAKLFGAGNLQVLSWDFTMAILLVTAATLLERRFELGSGADSRAGT